MWAGRTDGVTDRIADDFNSSIHFDSRMYAEDIKGSMAHAAMLGNRGIIAEADADKIIQELEKILADIESGALEIDMSCEDIHMFVEQVLTERIGDLGKKLHTARSRNDQVAVDMRLYMRRRCDGIQKLLIDLIDAIVTVAAEHKYDIMPGYTHLQRAQPIVFAHHLLAYAEMFKRDLSRITDAVARMNYSPLGACALAGTTYPISREMTAKALGFVGKAMKQPQLPLCKQAAFIFRQCVADVDQLLVIIVKQQQILLVVKQPNGKILVHGIAQHRLLQLRKGEFQLLQQPAVPLDHTVQKSEDQALQRHRVARKTAQRCLKLRTRAAVAVANIHHDEKIAQHVKGDAILPLPRALHGGKAVMLPHLDTVAKVADLLSALAHRGSG